MRRVNAFEPVARSAVWSRRLAISGILLAAGAVVASHGGVVEPLHALAMLSGGLVLAFAALVGALIATVVIWRTGRPGVHPTLLAVLLALLLLGYPAWLASKAAGKPAINDVSTDLVQPPSFAASTKAAVIRRSAVPALPADAVRQLQAAGYPHLQSLTIEAEAGEVYKAALKLVGVRRWVLVEAQPPAGLPPVGHIDAVAKTTLMGFRDDVTLRITAVSAGETRVDMRSASRVGVGDLGVNAARIEAFLADLDATIDEE